MNGTIHLRRPSACNESELREFARLVRQGFPGAKDLERRIGDSEWLAFHYAADDTLAGVAALKAPGTGYRAAVFEKANASISPADYSVELGWVFVSPVHRGNGFGGNLCAGLLACVPASSVFSTTRTDNALMMRILRALGFVRVGRPYAWRDEELVLFCGRA